MFQFLTFVFAATSHIALELSSRPSTIGSLELQNQRTKYNQEVSYFVDSKHRIRLSKDLGLDCVYDMHKYFEKGFSIEDYDFINKRENSYYIKGIESPVDKEALACLYYDALIAKNYDNIERGMKLNASSRDYYDESQVKEVNSVFANFGVISKIIPESTAILPENMLIRPKGAKYKDFVINLRGSQCVFSTFESSVEDKLIKIENTGSSVVCNFCDFEVERIIFEHLKEVLGKENKDIGFLPYDKNVKKHEFYCDILKHVNALAKSLQYKDYVHTFTDIFYFSAENKSRHTFIGVKVNMNDLAARIKTEFEEKIATIQQKIDAESADYNFRHITTDIPYLASLFANVSYLQSSYIAKGLNYAFAGQFELVDGRIVRNDFPIQNKNSKYATIKDEIRTMSNLDILDNIEPKIHSFEYVSQKSKDDFKSKYDLSAIDVKALGYGQIKEIIDIFSKMDKDNRNFQAVEIVRAKSILNFKNLLKEAKELVSESESLDFTVELKKALENALAWFAENKENKSISYIEYDSKSCRLDSYIKYHKKQLDKLKVPKIPEVEKPGDQQVLENDEAQDKEKKEFEDFMQMILKDIEPGTMNKNLTESMFEQYKKVFKKGDKSSVLEALQKELAEKSKKKRKSRDRNNKDDTNESPNSEDFDLLNDEPSTAGADRASSKHVRNEEEENVKTDDKKIEVL